MLAVRSAKVRLARPLGPPEQGTSTEGRATHPVGVLALVRHHRQKALLHGAQRHKSGLSAMQQRAAGRAARIPGGIALLWQGEPSSYGFCGTAPRVGVRACQCSRPCCCSCCVALRCVPFLAPGASPPSA